MDGKHNEHHGGNGFLIGVIVGVILTLLFTTAKGRKIFRMLSDEGLDKFADLEKLLDEKIQEVGKGVPNEKQHVAREEAVVARVVEEAKETHEDRMNGKEESAVESEPSLRRVTTSGRRFFRGVPKRS